MPIYLKKKEEVNPKEEGYERLMDPDSPVPWTARRLIQSVMTNGNPYFVNMIWVDDTQYGENVCLARLKEIEKKDKE